MPCPHDYHWEYSPLARLGQRFWNSVISPALETFAADEVTFYRKMRGVIQIILLVACLLPFIAPFYQPGHLFTASGLLFDIAGVLRLFLFEELSEALSEFKPNQYGNVPSVAMRELIMPEAGPYTTDDPHMRVFYFKKRGVLFLFVGFLFQMLGDLAG